MAGLDPVILCRLREFAGSSPAKTIPPGSLRRFEIALRRRANANKMAIAIDIVDTADRRPEFVMARSAQGEIGLFAGIRLLPILEQQMMSVGRVLQNVVGPVGPALLHFADFLADGDHGIAEAIELALQFRFRR